MDDYLANLLDEAEAMARCAATSCPAESSAVGSRASAGEFVRPRHGLFARTDYWDSLKPEEKMLHEARALGYLHEPWVFSHATAAFAYGLPASYRYLHPIHYVVEGSSGGRSGKGTRRHCSQRAPSTVVGGLRVTTPLRTVADCCLSLPFRDALPIADAAVRAGVVSTDGLERACEAAAGRRGVATLRRVCAHVDPRAESGGESFVRGVLIDLGFEVVDVQLEVPDIERPGRTRRLDIVLRRSDGRLVDLEVDGAGKYLDPEMTKGEDAVRLMMAERRREAGITAFDLAVIRMSPGQARSEELVRRRLALYGVHPQAPASKRARGALDDGFDEFDGLDERA